VCVCLCVVSLHPSSFIPFIPTTDKSWTNMACRHQKVIHAAHTTTTISTAGSYADNRHGGQRSWTVARKGFTGGLVQIKEVISKPQLVYSRFLFCTYSVIEAYSTYS
jgi:hypothetical protein